ncbi:unnamed protein product [Ranitomeya imitator]|uniref:Uncharacterized protein n=1 Tax=Ranitomeya imitator TaxID=111125 RepID=A0ABN9LPS1_9NEOB|nr:unnamed protein product [Ranitomeya imitator]
MNGTSASSVHGLPLVAVSGAAASEVPSTVGYHDFALLAGSYGMQSGTSAPWVETECGEQGGALSLILGMMLYNPANHCTTTTKMAAAFHGLADNPCTVIGSLKSDKNVKWRLQLPPNNPRNARRVPQYSVPKPITLLSVPVPSLDHLAFLCHQHGRNCNSPPTILAQPCSVVFSETPVLLWGCKKDHQFHWDPHAAFENNNAKEDIADLSSMDQNSTMEQENVSSMIIEQGPVINSENRISLQGTEIEPHNTVVQETLQGNQSRNDVQSEQCNDTGRITEQTSEHKLQMTPGNEWSLKSSVSETQQDQVRVTNEGLCQSIGHKILVSSVEDEDTENEDEDSVPPNLEVSEDTQESISIDLIKKKPETEISGRACRHQSTRSKLSQICQQAIMTKPKQPLASIPCRRSPRSSRTFCSKDDMKEDVSHSKTHITSLTRVSSDEKGQDLDVLDGSAPNTDLAKIICPVDDSLTEDVCRRKTPSKNIESLAAVEEHKEPQSESVEMSKVVGEDDQNSQIKPHEDDGQDRQSTQCRSQRTSRFFKVATFCFDDCFAHS